jgi:hypothetical protein
MGRGTATEDGFAQVMGRRRGAADHRLARRLERVEDAFTWAEGLKGSALEAVRGMKRRDFEFEEGFMRAENAIISLFESLDEATRGHVDAIDGRSWQICRRGLHLPEVSGFQTALRVGCRAMLLADRLEPEDTEAALGPMSALRRGLGLASL